MLTRTHRVHHGQHEAHHLPLGVDGEVERHVLDQVPVDEDGRLDVHGGQRAAGRRHVPRHPGSPWGRAGRAREGREVGPSRLLAVAAVAEATGRGLGGGGRGEPVGNASFYSLRVGFSQKSIFLIFQCS